MQNGIELRIKGKVQGVGFRPFVWLLANRFNLFGDVNNDGQGVLVRFYAPEEKSSRNFYKHYNRNYHRWQKLPRSANGKLVHQTFHMMSF
ncbi:putative acylphosphatase [Haemophilus pittmaniae HK 85]|uniref:acylphosphatase n=1 Tax=Haemophilus pittmaniae HK 85 TaxID=1035188 RepID=F9Q8N2_9PAST|nr:putative acylphosphatase [Haemophilus pittmaniae HK 85]